MSSALFENPQEELLDLQGARIKVLDVENFGNLEEHIGGFGNMPDKLDVFVVIGDVSVLDEFGGELNVKRR
jgi:hypothetical protein